MAEEYRQKMLENERKIVSLIVDHSDEKKYLEGKTVFLEEQLKEVKKITETTLGGWIFSDCVVLEREQSDLLSYDMRE